MPSEMLQQFYLSQCTLRQNLLAEDIRNLLNRNAFLGLGIRRSTEMVETLANIPQIV